MRQVLVGLALVALVALVSACDGSPARSDRDAAPTTTRSPLATGSDTAGFGVARPRRECATAIFSGPDSASIVRRDTTIVIGPAIFGSLGDPANTRAPAPGAINFVKSPLSITSAAGNWITLRVGAAGGAARQLYDVTSLTTAGTTAYRFADTPFEVQLPTPQECGMGENGFVQFNGGFALKDPECVEITVLDATGHELGSSRVPMGGATC